MKLVVDTGALLSIACSKFSEVIIRSNEIMIPESVKLELGQFAQYEDYLGIRAKEILKKGFKVINPKRNLEIKLGNAGSDVFAIALEHKITAITDDIHAARVASERLKLSTKPSFYLLILLYKHNKIKKEELIEDIKSILKYRNWIGGVLWEYALAMIEELK